MRAATSISTDCPSGNAPTTWCAQRVRRVVRPRYGESYFAHARYRYQLKRSMGSDAACDDLVTLRQPKVARTPMFKPEFARKMLETVRRQELA
jgi:hypothetical protein